MAKPTVGQTDVIKLRNRIKELRYVDTAELQSHPGNWRDHPRAQAAALAGVLREVGIVDGLLAYESQRAGGKLVLIDGHLRKDSAPGKWPVLVLDVDDAEADYILATFDPITSMAVASKEALDAILSTVQSGEAAVQAMLGEMWDGVESAALKDITDGEGGEREIDTPSLIRLVVDVGDVGEIEQAIMATGETSRADAILVIFREYLKSHAEG